MKWCDSLQPHTPSCNTQGCTAALPWRWMDHAQVTSVSAQCKASSPSSWQGDAQLCVEPEMWSSLKVCATHGSKRRTFCRLFGETSLSDDNCARWTIFVRRNLRSLSPYWCYKQLKAMYGLSKVKQFIHILSDLFIPSGYLHPLQLLHFLPFFSSINYFDVFLSVPTERDI